MKKLLAAFAAAIVALALGACASTGTSTSTSTTTTSSSVAATAATILANLQTVVVNGCSVAQPTLESLSSIDGTITAAATANGLFCTAASSITVTSAQTLLDTGIPAVIAAVNASTYIADAQKPIIVAALSLFELTVKNAIAAYNNAMTATYGVLGTASASSSSAASDTAASAAVAASSAQ
ncbi:hypothetical protein [Paraburkholderia tropica]|uniref:hypothetical protein n=1 Tax=Paraburkholderia tropica TaxID=92647 RepID=UPI002AAFF6A0|nr:hypothetical protein [Paraburkholderia tropica]